MATIKAFRFESPIQVVIPNLPAVPKSLTHMKIARVNFEIDRASVTRNGFLEFYLVYVDVSTGRYQEDLSFPGPYFKIEGEEFLNLASGPISGGLSSLDAMEEVFYEYLEATRRIPPGTMVEVEQ